MAVDIALCGFGQSSQALWEGILSALGTGEEVELGMVGIAPMGFERVAAELAGLGRLEWVVPDSPSESTNRRTEVADWGNLYPPWVSANPPNSIEDIPRLLFTRHPAPPRSPPIR